MSGRPQLWIGALVALGTLSLLGATRALGGIGDPTIGKVFSVPGVLQTSYFTTLFQCTNALPTGRPPITMAVEVFAANGASVGTASVILAAGATGLIATGPVGSLIPHATAPVPNGTVGAARITGSASGLICAAYMMSPNSSPGYVDALPIIAKTKQRGQ